MEREHPIAGDRHTGLQERQARRVWLWLGGDTFMSFDRKAVVLLSKHGAAAQLLTQCSVTGVLPAIVRCTISSVRFTAPRSDSTTAIAASPMR